MERAALGKAAPPRKMSEKKMFRKGGRKEGGEVGGGEAEDVGEEEEEEEEEEVDPDEVLGQYTLDDTLFLQGNWHEDLLVVGTVCEVFIDNQYIFNEEDVEWRPAEVAEVQVKTVKHKDAAGDVKNMSLRAYKVKVHRADGSELVLPIDPKEIRLRAPKPPEQLPTAEEEKQIELAELQGMKDPGWSTVSVSVVDEEAGHVVKLEDGGEGQVKVEGVGVKKEEEEEEKHEMEVLDDENDAYATFNPFGGDYKGFKVRTQEELRAGFEKEVVDTPLGSSEGKPKKAKFRSRKKKKRPAVNE